MFDPNGSGALVAALALRLHLNRPEAAAVSRSWTGMPLATSGVTSLKTDKP